MLLDYEFFGNILFFIGLMILLTMYFISNRRVFFFCNGCAAIFYASAMFTFDMQASGLALLVAATSSYSQIFFSEQRLKDTVYIRNIIAVLATAACIAIVYKTSTDIVPLICISIARFAETLSRTKHVKIGYASASSLWVQYGLFMELYFYVGLQLISTCMALYTTWVEEQKDKLVPASS